MSSTQVDPATDPSSADTAGEAALGERGGGGWWNTPNALTLLRLVLSSVLFAILAWTVTLPVAAEASPPPTFFHDGPLLLKVAFGIFLVAAITDTLDGQIARRWQLETDFGRIADPFADKVTICGSFVLLTAFHEVAIRPWMVVIIIAREFLVNGIRGFAEARGIKFPADWTGKAKMTLQCVAVGSALVYLGVWTRAGAVPPLWADITLGTAVWGALALTVVSGALYVARARRVLRASGA